MIETKFSDIVKCGIEEGQSQLVNIIKTLLYRSNPHLFELVDFYNNEIFLEPLLFAYFNAKEPQVTLEQILFGFIEDNLRPDTIKVYTDENGVIYLPNIGYFKTNLTDQDLLLVWNKYSKTFDLRDENNYISYDFNGIIRVEGTSIEICQYNHPLLKRFYTDEEGNVVNIEVTNITHKHIQHLNTAFEIIKKYYPDNYENILTVMKKIVIFKGERPNSFATLSAHGTAFLNAIDNDDEVFFIEDLVHQCGHVIFTALTLEKQEYFKVDPDTPLKIFTNLEQETRTIYVTFHGVFTEAVMNKCLNFCYENNVFSGKQKHELLGRLTFILERFKLDIDNLNHSIIFTEKGLLLFNNLKSILEDIYQKRQNLIYMFDLSNQLYNFSYEKFLIANSKKENDK